MSLTPDSDDVIRPSSARREYSSRNGLRTHLSVRPRPSRYHTDPSGTFVQYTAKAIGSGSEGAQTTLQELYRADLTLKEAETLALSTLKAVMEEKARSRLRESRRRAAGSAARALRARKGSAQRRRPASSARRQVSSTNVDIALVAPKYRLFTQARTRTRSLRKACALQRVGGFVLVAEAVGPAQAEVQEVIDRL